VSSLQTPELYQRGCQYPEAAHSTAGCHASIAQTPAQQSPARPGTQPQPICLVFYPYVSICLPDEGACCFGSCLGGTLLGWSTCLKDSAYVVEFVRDRFSGDVTLFLLLHTRRSVVSINQFPKSAKYAITGISLTRAGTRSRRYREVSAVNSLNNRVFSPLPPKRRNRHFRRSAVKLLLSSFIETASSSAQSCAN
jgi:hypothetical protein